MKHYDIKWEAKGKAGIGYNPMMTDRWEAKLEKGWVCRCEAIWNDEGLTGNYMLLFGQEGEKFILSEEELDKARNGKELRATKMAKWHGVMCKYTEINRQVIRFLEEV